MVPIRVFEPLLFRVLHDLRVIKCHEVVQTARQGMSDYYRLLIFDLLVSDLIAPRDLRITMTW